MARDVHFNSPEQVHNYMVDALKILASAKVPEDLRATALPVIYNSLASKQVFMDQSDVSGGVLLAAPGANTPPLQQLDGGVQVVTSPRPKVALTVFDSGTFTAVTYCAETYATDDGRVKVTIPKPLPRRNDLDVMPHASEYPSE